MLFGNGHYPPSGRIVIDTKKMNSKHIKHILVIDDEAYIRLGLYFLLKKEGYKVSTVGNGREAINKILTLKNNYESIDLLLLDIMMPDLSGLELIDKLKKLKINIPIFIITGWWDKEVETILKVKSYWGNIEKPIEPRELVKNINLIFQKIH